MASPTKSGQSKSARSPTKRPITSTNDGSPTTKKKAAKTRQDPKTRKTATPTSSKKKAKASPATQLAAIEPVAQVRIWIIEGQTEPDILDACREHFRASPKRAKELIAQAFALITKTGNEVDSTALRGWCIEAYGLCFRRMTEIGDYANALRAIDKLWKIAKE